MSMISLHIQQCGSVCNLEIQYEGTCLRFSRNTLSRNKSAHRFLMFLFCFVFGVYVCVYVSARACECVRVCVYVCACVRACTNGNVIKFKSRNKTKNCTDSYS